MRRKILSSDYYTIRLENESKLVSIHTLPTLYKFQPVTEYTLHNFEHDEIWGSIPSNFNDPYDCIFCCNHSKLILEIIKNLSEKRLNDYKKFFSSSNKTSIAKEIAQQIINNDFFRTQYGVSCFSIYYDSEIMWGHYADSAKGFCLAYDSAALKNMASATSKATFDTAKMINPFNIDYSDIEDDNLISIMPIIYQNGKYNITQKLIQYIPIFLEYFDNICNGLNLNDAINILLRNMKKYDLVHLKENNNIFYSIMCNKNKVWQYEQEWRIWTYNSNIFSGNYNSPYVKMGTLQAKAVYLGEKMPEYTRRILIDIANSKNIPVYQMKLISHSRNCKLIPFLIQNK